MGSGWRLNAEDHEVTLRIARRTRRKSILIVFVTVVIGRRPFVVPRQRGHDHEVPYAIARRTRGQGRTPSRGIVRCMAKRRSSRKPLTGRVALVAGATRG